MYTSKKQKVGVGLALSIFTIAMIVAPFVAGTEVVGGFWSLSAWFVWRGGW